MPHNRHSAGHSGTFTADFRHEFEAETRALLRTRFLWFNGLLGALWGLMLVWGVVRIIRRSLESAPVGVETAAATDVASAARHLAGLSWQMWVSPFFELVALAGYAASFWAVRRGRVSDPDLLRLTYWLVFIDGALRVVMESFGIPGGFSGLWGVALAHVLACSFLPWTPRQAVGPILPLLGLNAASIVFLESGGVGGKIGWIAASCLVGLPGTAIAWFKHSRRMENYRTRFFQRRYGELRRELVDARRIHEALFPAPRATGPVRFTYRYEPMRQIGGDYLFAFFSPGARDGRLSIVVMDVTGHGIPAALTVNRLHGELERVFAEDPGVRPGEVLKLLNRYVHLTLATHSVYVTALCVRVDCGKGDLEYASGGHPPAFLRAVDGTIQELPSTAFVLGACADADFDPGPSRYPFGPGDTVIAYTDGAIEARDRMGRMLGVQGFARLVSGLRADPQVAWSEMLLSAVEQHRYGPPKDDTLVIEVTRPVQRES